MALPLGTSRRLTRARSPAHLSPQDSGQHLSVVDDCNDHMLTVWDWQKKSKVAEIKVRAAPCPPPGGSFLRPSSPFVLRVGALQTTTDVVLAVEFHPVDPNTIITCGKSHIFFWAWSGTSLARKQGIFGVGSPRAPSSSVHAHRKKQNNQ